MSVSNSLSSANYTASPDFAFQKVSRNLSGLENPISVLDLMEDCGMVSVTETAAFDFPNYPEAKKRFEVVYFELDESFTAYQGLFRGLVSSGKPKGVILESNRALGNFTLKYYDSDTATVLAYLGKIFDFLHEEIRFKTVLKKLIEKEKRAKLEEMFLYKELFA